MRARADELLFGPREGRPTRVQAQVIPRLVEVWHEGTMRGAARAQLRTQQQILDLEHYLDVLEQKPGALAGANLCSNGGSTGAGPPVTIDSGRR